MWINDDFESMNIPINGGSERHIRSAEDPHLKTLFVNKPIEVADVIVRNLWYET